MPAGPGGVLGNGGTRVREWHAEWTARDGSGGNGLRRGGKGLRRGAMGRRKRSEEGRKRSEEGRDGSAERV